MKTMKSSWSWRSGILSVLILVCLFAGLVLCVPPGRASEYDPKQAGHPLRLAAYVLHPVGTLLDYCLMRPAYWVVQREPFSTVFGAERQQKVEPAEAAQRQ